MEGFSTFKSIQELATLAAQDYNNIVEPEVFSKLIVASYLSEDAPESIKNNDFYIYLLENYPDSISTEVVRILSLEVQG